MDRFDLAIRRKFELVERTREDMHLYQEECVEFLMKNPFSALFIDLGMGKTISSLTVIAELLENLPTDEKILVIGPVKVIADTWPTEVALWKHVAWMNYTVIRGEGSKHETPEQERERLARSPTQLHFINREMVEWLVYFWKEKWPYRTVFVDECFVAGTVISTPTGGQTIEKLLPGDLVSTPYGPLPLSRVIRKRSTSITTVHLENGQRITCTSNHKWLTDVGWVTAHNLEGRIVYGEEDIASVQLRELRERVLDVEVSPEVLRSFLRSKSCVGQRSDGTGACKSTHVRSVQEGFYAMEQEHTMARTHSQENGQRQVTRRIHVRSGREWQGNEQARRNVVKDSGQGLDLQLYSDSRNGQGQRISDALQDRFRVAEKDDRFGSGRVEPRQSCSSGSGSSQRTFPRGSRVVRVSHQECGSGVDVFDLTVEGAPFYFAEGCVVHNCSAFKDHTSKRFQALAKVRNTTGLITRLHIMTATPAAETYVHLFPQIYLLDRGERLGKNITAYRNEHFIYNKYKMKYIIRPSSEETILKTLADICLVMKKKDYLKSTEPTVQLHRVKLDAPHLDLIKELERKFIITLPDGTEIEAKTAAMLSSMMLQMASGTVYETLLVEDFETDDLKKVKKVHHIHDHKIKALKEIVEEAQTQGTSLLVAYHFQSSLAKLRKAFPKATVMDKEGKCIKAWNAGKIPVMFIHPQSAGHGLNLQHGGHILIFYDLIYSLENYLQTIGRLDRQGQKNPVLVKMLVAEGTRDEIVAKTLAEKKDAQEKLFSILKRLIARLKKERALLQ